MPSYILQLLTFFTFIALSGCGNKSKPVTKDEAIAYAKKLEASMATKQPELFNEILDERSFIDAVNKASGGKLSQKLVRTIPDIIKRRRLGDELLSTMGSDGEYSLVKIYEKEGKQRLIFRVYGLDGLNYHDIELVNTGREIRASDIFIYTTGENLSRTFADLLVDINKQISSTAEEQQFADLMKDIRKKLDGEQYQEARDLFVTLPSWLQKQKTFQLMNLRITSNLDDESYKVALEEFKRSYPHDPSLFISLIDLHFLNKEYDYALKDVDALDSVINKDPFLDYYRGLIYNAKEDRSTAIKCFERLLQKNPSAHLAMVELTSLYAEQGDTKKAKAMLTNYRRHKKFSKDTDDALLLLHPELEI
jgi:hypothetical protein